MKAIQIGLIMFQVVSVCFFAFGLGCVYKSKGIPKWLRVANIGILILNFILILNNLYRL